MILTTLSIPNKKLNAIVLIACREKIYLQVNEMIQAG